MGRSVCAARNCKNKSYNCNLSFFHFPKDRERCLIWLSACVRDDLQNKIDKLDGYRLCGCHFEDRMFTNSLRNRLLPIAIPTIFPSVEGSSRDIQEEHDYSLKSGSGGCLTSIETVPSAAFEEIISMDYEDPSENVQYSNILQEDSSTTRAVSPVGQLSPSDILQEGSSTSRAVSPEANFSPPTTPKSTQTEQSLSLRSPRKLKLKKSLKQIRHENELLKKQNQKLKQQLNEAKNNFLRDMSIKDYMSMTYKFCPSQELANFINTQVSLIQKHPKGRRYSIEFKNECLAMYFTGPKLYTKKLMSQFCLPTPTTLLKLVKNIKVAPGTNNPEFFTMLKMKINCFSDEDKLCMLCVDEMSIKAHLFYAIIGLEDDGMGKKVFKPALSASVFMIRGLQNKWSQPLCYNFFHSNCPSTHLKVTLYELVKKLKEIGLTVCAVISDMGSNNIQLANLLHITSNQPYFHVNQQKIIFMFDTPHLLKSVRNNLKKHSFRPSNGEEISWKYIEMFYQHDKQYPVRSAPKLTDSHIYPNNFEKMKVKFASQVFSQAVASGINLYMRFGAIPAGAIITAEFVDMMDKLFDLLNSSNSNCTKHFNNPFKGEQYQLDFLNECVQLFSEIRIIDKRGNDVTNRIKFLECFKITIKGLMHLWDCWLSEQYKHLFTRRLNQDCLENFFGTIRQQNGNCINPTAIQFQRSFKKLICMKLFHSGTENCQGDTDSMLLRLNDIKNIEESTCEQTSVPAEKIDSDYRTSDILQKNIERYICGYLIKKCLGIHKCKICEDYALDVNDLDDTTILCYFKTRDTDDNLRTFGKLMMPHEDFVIYISKLHSLFESKFEEFIVCKDIVKQFMYLSKEFLFEHPCTNFPATYLVKLYFRLRIFYTLKFINRNLRTPNKNKLIIWKHQ